MCPREEKKKNEMKINEADKMKRTFRNKYIRVDNNNKTGHGKSRAMLSNNCIELVHTG